MYISIGIVALNEEKHLEALFNDLCEQTYDHSLIEILLIDSGSSDNTVNLMNRFKNDNPGHFNNILILENQNKTQAAGWNVAIKHFSGHALSRIDAHSRINPDFIRFAVADLEKGENVVGGIRPSIIENDSEWAKTLLQVENSLFGSSLLKSRSSTKKQYVKTMFHATYKRDVFVKVGGFNEFLLRTEDNEFHYRISKEGFMLLYDPRIISYQYARSSFKKMIKQKYGNGYWIGKTLKYCPRCLSLYHIIPLLFVLGIIATSFLAFFSFWYLSVAMWGVYFLFAIATAIASDLKDKFYFYHIIMPFMFLILHVAYGVGTLFGLISFGKIKKAKSFEEIIK